MEAATLSTISFLSLADDGSSADPQSSGRDVLMDCFEKCVFSVPATVVYRCCGENRENIFSPVFIIKNRFNPVSEAVKENVPALIWLPCI